MLPPISDEQMMWYILKGYTIDVDAYGHREWWLNGQLHREGGPAVEWENGNREWWLNGQLHREGGPACEYADGTRAWYLNDQNMTEEEHRKLTQKKMANIG